MPRPACPKCGERQCSRRKREGLWQRFILPKLGWFPWQCTSCRKVFLVKERGKSKRKPFTAGQNYGLWQPEDRTTAHEDDHLQDDEAGE